MSEFKNYQSPETPEADKKHREANKFEIFSDNKFSGKFGKVLNKSSEIYKEFKRSLAIGMAVVFMSQGISNLRTAEFPGSAQVVKSPEEKEGQERREHNLFTEEDIRREVSDSSVEKGFVSIDGGKIFIAISDGGKMFVNMDFAEVRKYIELDKSGQPVNAHIHPIEVYAGLGYTKQELADIKDGKAKPKPIPPSYLDIEYATALEDYLGPKESAALHYRVYDPTGVWEYSIDDKNPNIKIFKEYQRDRNDRIKNVISEKDKKLILAKKINLLSPNERIEAMLEDPEMRPIGEKIKKIVSYEIEKYGNVIEKMSDIEIAATEVRSPDLPDSSGQDVGGEDEEYLIKEYIKTCKPRGIKMSYHAYGVPESK
ncbi:MAG: hypothetical protein KGJ89_00060 [Patescibacteria group bacterium]|nr:hypothetical protein [Patescibacteria group bacterium]MDE2014915.1 hypothetical protein [Patescibacteria group bacterium]MDE2226344.1 hypothetical protein [Patescibacteria group bacterium]